MKSTTFLIKPASSLCNMRCKYCFYDDVSDNRMVKSMGIMSADTAAQVISKALEATEDGGRISFMFQGGEPTLAGLNFFQNFVQLQQQSGRSGIVVEYAIQTNGMNLDEEWAEFLRKNRFLVGLSIDGTKDIHDQFRVDARGEGSWQQVEKALRLLDEHQVETNLLCVVTRQMAKKAHQVWSSLRALGNHPLQFIACLDPLECKRGTAPYSLTPELYGRFLCNLFDCWYRDWKAGNYGSVRLFDDYVRILAGMAPSCCANAGSCGHYLVVEGDGSLYPCDFFVLDQWYIGNIHSMTVAEALAAPASQKFVAEGMQRPEECYHCPYGGLCRGGCRRDWTLAQQNYYCQAYKAFFPYALSRLQEIARHI